MPELRLKCYYCTDTFTKVADGITHERECQYNPKNKACAICQHQTSTHVRDAKDKEIYVSLCTKLKSADEQKDTKEYNIIADTSKNNCENGFEIASWRVSEVKPVKVAKQLRRLQTRLDNVTKESEMIMLGKLLYKLLGGGH